MGSDVKIDLTENQTRISLKTAPAAQHPEQEAARKHIKHWEFQLATPGIRPPTFISKASNTKFRLLYN